MNKIRNNYGLSNPYGSFLKLLRIMKISALFLFCGMLSIMAGPSYSQETKISLNIKNSSVETALNKIEEGSEFYFMFNQKLIDVNRKVDVYAVNSPIKDVLTEIFDGQDVKFGVYDRQIILVPQQESKIIKQIQSIEVSGSVIDGSTGEPLIGVNVVVEGTTVGVITDTEGKFAITIPEENSILVFSFIGFKTQQIIAGGRSVIDLELIPDIRALDEIVVIGYGSQRRVEVTSAVATVTSDDFVTGDIRDIGQLLQGKVAGLSIGTPSGNPAGSTEIMLRGTGTLNSSVSPLILIDGIPGDLNTVAPQDVESVDVLKDGSAAAIYGTRGSNGVILVTTKNVSGVLEPTVTYSGYVSTQHLINIPEMLTADQYRDRLANGTTGFTDLGSSTDWVEEISRDVPISHSQNLSVRGGTGQTSYIASFGFRNDQGVINTTERRQMNNRIDINQKMFGDKVKLNVNLIQNDTKGSPYFDDVAFRSANRYNPTAPIYNPDGTYYEDFGPTENYNPVAMINETFGENNSQYYRVGGSLIWQPIDGLNLKFLGSSGKGTFINSLGHTKQHFTNTNNGKNGEASRSSGENRDRLIELSADYSKTIGYHNFKVLGGYSYQDFENQVSGMYNYDFPVGNFSYVDNIGLGDALKLGLGSQNSAKYVSNLIGFFGRGTYNYKEKYLVAASLRYEANSHLLGTEEPWGLFPAVSAGWRISEEGFMQELDFLDNLKFRAGYGVTGTAPGQPFLGVNMLQYSGNFFIDGSWIPSIVPASNANPYLKWEERHETNIGLDFAVFRGRLNGSVDFYNRTTNGLLYDYQVPSPPNLYGETKANVGVMENKGLEVMLAFVPVQNEKFVWNSIATFSTNTNKLVSLENDLYTLTTPYFDDGRSPTPIGEPTHRIEVGQPIGNFYGYEVVDITEDGKWVYINGEGEEASRVYPGTDRKVIGNGLPKYFASWNNTFRYGNIDLDINMRGAFGFEIMNATRMVQEQPGFDNYNLMVSAFDKVFDKAVLANSVSPQNNTYYVEKGDYWKIDNIVLGYNFGMSKVKHISNARLYVSAQNAFTFTNYSGMDPEVTFFGTTGSQRLTPGYDNRERYPTARVFSLGLSVTFK